jgi:hypothetical protein
VKVKKQDLEKITQGAAKVGLLAFVSLVALNCDVPEVYEVLERFLKRTEDLRKDLGLDRLVPEDVTSGMISSAIKAKQVTHPKKAVPHEMVDVEDLISKEGEGNPELEQKLKDMFTGVVDKNVN